MSDSGALTCAKHPKVETYLRCARCETPICDKCAVLTSVGYKCRDCGTLRQDALFRPSLLQLLAALGVGLLAGVVVGTVGHWVGPFILLFIGLPVGRFVGSLMLKVSGGKVGLLMEIVTVVSIMLGGLLAQGGALLLVLAVLAHGAPIPLAQILRYIDPMSLIACAVVSAVAISRLRFSWGLWGM